MIPEIDKFRSLFRDFARPNRFKIKFYNIPVDESLVNRVEELIKGIGEFPTYEIAQTKLKRMGKNFTIYNELQNEGNISINFMVDETLSPVVFFRQWTNNYMNDWKSNMNYRDDVSDGTTLEVYQYNIDLKQQLGKYIFYNIKPMSISGINYNHESDEQIMECTIAFSFTDYDFEKV